MNRLATSATSLRERATNALSQNRQTNTRRRVEMAANIERRAQRDLERAHVALRIANGEAVALTWVKYLSDLESLETILRGSVWMAQQHDRHAGEVEAVNFVRRNPADAFQKRFASSEELRENVAEMVALRGTPPPPDPVKELERKLTGARINGFFPTPKDLAAEMVLLAQCRRGGLYLEPSAGSGRIADAIRDVAGTDSVLCVEINQTLVSLLRAKGHVVHDGDFLEDVYNELFDGVLMNPPFEDGLDGIHVRHAHGLLKPGAPLVAIVGAGLMSRSDKKSVAFREWFASVGGCVVRELPSGTFNHSDVTQRTNVRALLITINA